MLSLSRPLLRPLLFASATSCCYSMASGEAPLVKPGVKDPKAAPNIYAFNALDIDGNLVDLEKYKVGRNAF